MRRVQQWEATPTPSEGLTAAVLTMALLVVVIAVLLVPAPWSIDTGTFSLPETERPAETPRQLEPWV
jgi:hypothetical protein